MREEIGKMFAKNNKKGWRSVRSGIVFSLLLIVFLLMSNVASAVDTSWVAPSSNAGGSGVTTPQNAYASDTSYAVFASNGNYWNWYGYGFSSIPSGTIINGIEVNARGLRQSGCGTSCLMRVRLSYDGGTSWTNYKDTATWNATNSDHIVGGAADNWGRSWTRDEIVNNFRVQTLWQVNGSTQYTGSLDYLSVRVTYTPGTASTYNLLGYVTNKTSGARLSGANVSINTTPQTYDLTDALGYYNFSGLSNGTYVVSASLTGYSTNSTTIAISGADAPNINISLSSIGGGATTTTYRWRLNSGTAIATGVTTNWGTCGQNPNSFTTALLTNLSDSGCATDFISVQTLDPAVDMFFNTAYSADTNVQGNWYYGNLWDDASGGGTFTFRLIYVYPNGTKVILPGSASQNIPSGSSQTNYNISLTGISGTVPAGAKPGLRVSVSTTSTLRSGVGNTGNAGATGPAGYFSVTETPAGGGPQTYNLSGYVINQSSGAPVNGATVTTNTSLNTTTDSLGYYIFTGLSNGVYFITASLLGYFSNSTTGTISGADASNTNISLLPQLPAQTYQLSGYVKNQSNGAAIQP
jgi:hypothetical protein